MEKKHTFDFSKIEFNTGLLVKEMIKRSINVSYLGDSQVIIAKYNDHVEYLDETNTNMVGYSTKYILDNKYTTKLIIQQLGFQSMKGFRVHYGEFTKALQGAQDLGFPLVVKPTMGSHGNFVYMNINSREAFIDAFRKVEKSIEGLEFNQILIEKQFQGDEFRIFVTKLGFIAAVQRVPASIIGDGKKTIEELIHEENYKRMHPRNTCLCTIKINDITKNHLSSQGMSITTIPQQGAKISIRPNSNVCTGGNCYDITDTIHESVKKLAFDIIKKLPDVPYIGIDMMSTDITKQQDKKSYMICEINTNPGISLHTHEETGTYRDVPGAIIDMLFPETA